MAKCKSTGDYDMPASMPKKSAVKAMPKMAPKKMMPRKK